METIRMSMKDTEIRILGKIYHFGVTKVTYLIEYRDWASNIGPKLRVKYL